MIDWEKICTSIASKSGHPFHPEQIRPIAGGCINSAYRVSDRSNQSYLVKLNSAEKLMMFQAEADGLGALSNTATFQVPLPLCWGVAGNQSFLVLEWLELGGNIDSAEAGRKLAELHRSRFDCFGWHRDNYIGTTPQRNEFSNEWITFWAELRLGFQLQLASRAGHLKCRQLGEKLIEELPALINHSPCPSLIHGDLWNGNIGCTRDGETVIYDPAVYFADRETEIAMTELFGGFAPAFYDAYNEAWPLDRGYSLRKDLYNLYHILNHCNLFGGGYCLQAERMIRKLLAELGKS